MVINTLLLHNTIINLKNRIFGSDRIREREREKEKKVNIQTIISLVLFVILEAVQMSQIPLFGRCRIHLCK